MIIKEAANSVNIEFEGSDAGYTGNARSVPYLMGPEPGEAVDDLRTQKLKKSDDKHSGLC